MIRMVLLGIGFLAITIALIAFQPGARRNALPDPRDGTVTRADPALAALPEPVGQALLLFVGCYQVPMFLTPLLLAPLYRRLGDSG